VKPARKILIVFILSCLVEMGVAAPLFPDVPENHWAKDAVAALAAKGLVEGYPDGTFKGDRAASRWETAMIVARLLAKMEQAHATFATKAELDELRKLVNALREELDALGVRVTNLEENVELIDRRVTELERITFYGSFETRIVFQSFGNDGVGDNDSLRNGGGLMGNVPFMNYNNAVGSSLGGSRRPQLHAVMPVVNYKNGRALTNGTGFTSRAILGLNIVVNPDIDAGAEFSAYTSQGDAVVDAYWGVSAPWLSNPFTANQGGDLGAQSLNHTPYTRMNLDKFWVYHKPSKTRVTVGQIDKTNMDPMVYVGQVNLGVYGPARWAGWGADVTGEFSISDASKVSWEAFRTQFGNGDAYLGVNYQNYVIGGNAAYHFRDGAGKIQLNLLRISEEASTGGPLVVGGFGPGGGTTGMNVPYGSSVGWTVRQWVNTPGHFAGQRSAFEQANTGQLVNGVFQPNTVDTRPIAGWNGTADNALGFTAGGGNFGPQSQDIYGLTGQHRWALGEEENAPTVGLEARWARSDYKPSKNSGYSATGDAFHVAVDATLLDDTLDLEVEYLNIDPRYAPAAWFGNVLGVRFPRSMNFTGVWHPHNFAKYPQNREGFRLNGDWSFNDEAGLIWAKGRLLDQKTTSLYDVRVTPGALGPGIPTSAVLGFSPGFVDPIFSGYASPAIYGPFSGNSFTANLAPLEDPRGSEDGFELGFRYRWREPGLKLSASYGHTSLTRNSSLTPLFGGDQNQVDLDIDIASLALEWEANKKLTLTGGVDYTLSAGHLDPGGLYHAYALRTGNTNFKNIDSEQVAPFVALDYDLTDTTEFGLSATHYSTTDNVDPSVRAGTAFDSFGSSAHPFDWSGIQVESYFRLRF
jgi:S-layer family protein